jgi:hypothetical protein
VRWGLLPHLSGDHRQLPVERSGFREVVILLSLLTEKIHNSIYRPIIDKLVFFSFFVIKNS